VLLDLKRGDVFVRIILPLIIIGLALIMCWRLLDGASNAGTSNADNTQSTKVQRSAMVKERPLVNQHVFTPTFVELPILLRGVVKPRRQVQLVAAVDGLLVHAHPFIGAGKVLDKGDLIYEIEAPQLKAHILAAKSQLHQAQQNLTQLQAQLESAGQVPGLNTPTAYRNTLLGTQKSLVAAAQSDVQLAEQRYDQRLTRAPFSGMVNKSSLTEGQMIAAGADLGAFYSPSDLQVEIGMSVDDLQLLNSNPRQSAQDIDVVIAKSSTQNFDYFQGELQSKNGVVDPTTGLEQLSVQVETSPTAELMPGERVDVRLKMQSAVPLLKIPLGYLRRNQLFGITEESTSQGITVGKVVRLDVKRVHQDLHFAYFEVPQPSTLIRVLDNPPSWVVPGHEIEIQSPSSQQQVNG